MGNKLKKINKEKKNSSDNDNNTKIIDKNNTKGLDNNNIKKEKSEFYKDKFKLFKIINEKRMSVINICLLNDGRICACNTYDMYIYNKNYEQEAIIPITPKCFCQIQLKNDLLILGSSRCIEIIKLELNNSYSREQEIPQEDITLSIIEFSKSNFIIGLINSNIKIYKKKSKTNEYENYLQLDNSFLNNNGICLCLINNFQFVSAFNDINRIKFYDIDNDKISLRLTIKNIECCYNRKTLCLFNNILIVGCKNDKGFYFINLKNYSIIGVINGFGIHEVNTIIKLKDNKRILVSFFDERNIQKILEFKYENNRLIKTRELFFNLDFDIVYGIAELDDDKICYASYHGRTIIVE